MTNVTTRGAILMVFAMAVFAVEDTLIKLVSARLPVGQILMMLGGTGAVVFAGLARLEGARLWSRNLLSPSLMIRNAAEVVGTIGFVTALALIPLTTASAILQAAPLVVVLGAAVFLREPVGWRRWAAVLTGFGGVLLVIKPGWSGFDGNALYAVVGVIGLAIRDLATRRIPAAIPSKQIAGSAFAALVPAGVLVMVVTGTPVVRPVVLDWGLLGCALVIGVIAYLAIIAATRDGDMSVIAPMRYSRILFALIIGYVVFGERPDAAMIAGCVLIVASGTYAIWREARIKQRAASIRATPGV